MNNLVATRKHQKNPEKGHEKCWYYPTFFLKNYGFKTIFWSIDGFHGTYYTNAKEGAPETYVIGIQISTQ